MDHRRFVTFVLFYIAFTYVYFNYISPKFFPPPPNPAAQLEEEGGAVAAGDDAAAGDAETGDSGDPESDADGTADDENAGPAIHPNQRLTLGSQNPESGFFLEVDVNSAGACIESIVLADPNFRDLKDQDRQVQVVGNNSTEDRTFTMAVATVDEQLKPHQMSLETLDWKVEASDDSFVTFSFDAPDGSLRLEKTYRLAKIDVAESERREAFRRNSKGFIIDVDLTVRNLSDAETVVNYDLQGPVGVILENVEHTRKYRDIKLEFLDENDAVTMGPKAVNSLYEEQLSEAVANNKTPTPPELRRMVRRQDAWTDTIRYAAVDVQFFAAIVTTDFSGPDDGAAAVADEGLSATPRWIERTYPVMVEKDRLDIQRSDISFRMVSTDIRLLPGESKSHRYHFFAGPKRSDLLDPPPLEATQVLDYGSWFGTIARGMHYLLAMFHSWGMPYFLAIISLTVLVRGLMFPLSRKQAISAAKMKELQPKIKELQTKYGEDKQKIAQAQMELWRKHNINPLGGCFPLVFQLPIFISLYTCLNTSVDLRLSRFLWIDNLAAPDALFAMPTLPFLGSDFNLLPCITVVLFLIQQKLFMPPAADEQQEMQQKMMNFMTIFFGVMFWHVPAGLCIYFIASSLWGIAERKLLGNVSVAVAEPTVTVKESTPNSKSTPKADESDRPKGFFARLMEAAEDAQKQQQKQQTKTKGKKKKGR